jgi:ArsR family transcriptional regulator, cadmium/lead-responsive transcriptional repressor
MSRNLSDDLLLKAKLLRGFADPSRLAVLETLREGAKCVSDVVKLTGLSQPNASAHLACLGDCGLVRKERRGRFIYYQIAHENVTVVLELAEETLSQVGDCVYGFTRYGGHTDEQRPHGAAPARHRGDVLC